MSGFAELLPGTHPKTNETVDAASLKKFPWPERDVFVFGDDGGKPVLATHELPGFTPQFVNFCRALAGKGFTVYAPLLFGKVGDNASGRNLLRIAFSRDWYIIKNATPRIVLELRRLADAIHAVNPRNMGAIGMCLTGQFPVAMLGLGYMKAAVLSQPSMPFTAKAELALDGKDIEAARRSAVPMIGFRFKTDKICQAPRQVRLETVFSRQIDFEALPAAGEQHAVLTKELFDDQGNMRTGVPAFEAFQKTVRYLDTQL